MPEQENKSSHKRYSNHKAKYAQYYSNNTRSKNKLKRFIKNNVGKDWDEGKVNKAISKFKDMQYKKHQKHILV